MNVLANNLRWVKFIYSFSINYENNLADIFFFLLNNHHFENKGFDELPVMSRVRENAFSLSRVYVISK